MDWKNILDKAAEVIGETHKAAKEVAKETGKQIENAANDLAANMVTDKDKQEAEYGKMLAQLPTLRSNVATVMGQANLLKKELDILNTEIPEWQRKVKVWTDAGAPDRAVEFQNNLDKANARIPELTGEITEAQERSTAAIKALSEATETLKRIGAQLGKNAAFTSDERLARSAQSLSSDIASTVASIQERGEAIEKSSGKIGEKLETARALDQLASGSSSPSRPASTTGGATKKPDSKVTAAEEAQKRADLGKLLASGNEAAAQEQAATDKPEEAPAPEKK
jgi:phage shock protein A